MLGVVVSPEGVILDAPLDRLRRAVVPVEGVLIAEDNPDEEADDDI